MQAAGAISDFRLVDPHRVSSQPVPPQRRLLVPLGLVLAGVLSLGALVDIISGATAGAGEAVHLLEVAGVALLWLLAHRDDDARATQPVLAR